MGDSPNQESLLPSLADDGTGRPPQHDRIVGNKSTSKSPASPGFGIDHHSVRPPVSPHELPPDRREEYLNELWDLFLERAVQGRVPIESAVSIALAIPVEGATTSSMQAATAQEEVTFDELVAVLDKVSRDASAEFQDIDVEQRETHDEVALAPHMYLWSKMPCTTMDQSVKYKLEPGWRLVDVRPKTTLVITTSLLMAFIGTSLLIVIFFLWSTTARTRENQAFETTRSTLGLLIDKFELEFFRDHSTEMADQTMILANLADKFFSMEMQQQMERNARSALRVAAAANSTGPVLREDPLVGVAAIVAMGVALDPTRLAMLLDANGHTDVLSGKGVHRSNASQWCALQYSSGTPLLRPYYIAVDPSTDPVMFPGACVLASPPATSGTTAEWLAEWSPTDPNGTTVTAFVPGVVRPRSCVTASGIPVCGELERLLLQGVRNGTTVAMNNSTVMWSAAPMEGSAGFVVVATDFLRFQRAEQDGFVAEVNFLNFAFVRTTEIVVGRFQQGQFVTQATLFRFFDGCYAACERLAPSRRNAELAWKTKSHAESITPDYRPEPVAGAAIYMPKLDLVLLLERDVQEIRGLGLTRLVELLDDINRVQDEFEVQVFRHVGRPPMRDFDPNVPCGPHEDCISLPAPIGVYFRYDCVHCQRVHAFARNATIQFLTAPKFGLQPGVASMQDTFIDDVYQDVLYTQRDRAKEYTDYTGTTVRGSAFFVANYSIGVMVKMELSAFTQSWWFAPTRAVLISAALLVAGLLVVAFSTNISLSSMERDWLSAKEAIEREKAHFARIVADLVPPNLSQRMLKGVRFVSDTHNNVAMVFADVCGFSDWTAAMTPRHTVRLAAYCFHALQTVADTNEMQRLGAIGDVYIVYGHTADSRGQPMRHAAVRSSRYAVQAAMVFSPLCEHWPERIKGFREAFKDRSKAQRPFAVPKIRFGGHCGVVPSGIVEHANGSPRFDCYGMVPALAARMCATSTADRLHVTSIMRDAVANHDTAKSFLWDEPRKTIVRGQGTVTSYFVRGTTHEVTNELLASLSATRAPLAVNFDGQKRRVRVGSVASNERSDANNSNSLRREHTIGGNTSASSDRR